MQNFKDCKAVYKRIHKGEKLDRKIMFGWSKFRIEFMDFEWRCIAYEWLRTEKKLFVRHNDRERDWTEIITVSLTDKDDVFLDWYWPEQKPFTPLKKSKDDTA